VMDGILARRTAAPEIRAEVHLHRADMAELRSDSAGMLHHATEALRWYRSTRHLPRRLEPVFLATLAYAYHLNDRNDEADRQFGEAIARFEALGLGESPAALQQLQSWGLVQQQLGDLHRAIELYDRSLAGLAKSSPEAPRSHWALGNRAYAFTQMGCYDRAEADYAESLALANELRFDILAYNLRMCIADLYAEQGRVADAEAMLHAAESSRQFDLPEGSPAADARRVAEARLATLKGETAKAVALYTSALGDRELGAGSVVALLGRADAYQRASEFDLARTDARDALSFAQRLQGSKPASFRTGFAYLALARASAALGNAHEARSEATAAVSHLEATVVDTHPALASARALAVTVEQSGHLL
jgi:tetratricopeptide (TPR) repeat protein